MIHDFLNKTTNHIAIYARLSFLLALGAASSAFCQVSAPSDTSDNSVLRKFEKSAQPSPEKPAAPYQAQEANRRYSNDKQDSHGNAFGNEMFNLVMDVMAESGKITLSRLSSDTDLAQQRVVGDILIPFVRYDFAYQNISSNIIANSHRVEAGYGPFALSLEDYAFHEQAPDNTLTIKQQLLLYRMSVNRIFEVDFGLGQTIVSGAKRTTLDTFSIPLRLAFSENIALEFRPTWANTIDDYEIALHWGRQYGSVKIGYRTLISTGDALSGPFAGFSLCY